MVTSYNILIVEDDKDQLKFIKTLLSAADKTLTGIRMLQDKCKVYAATSASEANHIIAKKSIDLAFIDKNLGKESGISVCKDISMSIPCVLMSGEYASTSIDAIAQADTRDSGALATLSKPFSINTFYQRLNMAINAAKTKREAI